MIPLGLSASAQAALADTLAASHSTHVSVSMLSLNGARLADLTWRLLDGQVNIDGNATVTRSCTLQLLDPNRTMAFDSDSPSDGALYLDRMIAIDYAVKAAAPDSAPWVTVPLFRGPVVKLDRTDDVINVECQGKELLAMGAMWHAATYPAGWRTVDVIQHILSHRTGERTFSFPESTVKLPKAYPVSPDNTPWGVARHLAQGLGLQLFYDGRGTCRLRPLPQTSTFRFRDGDGGAVLTSPQITYSIEDVRNAVRVKGAVPKGAPGPITAEAVATPPHPLSPWRIGRNSVPRYLPEVYENSTIATPQVAHYYAESILRSRLLEAVDVAFDALPVPYFDPLDVARVETDQYSAAFRVSRLSIPLLATQPMSVGYLSKVSLNSGSIRRLRR